MSRSLKKTPIFGILCSPSEKKDKRRWNKTFRRVTKKLIFMGLETPKKIEAVTNVYDGDKDGKRYWRSVDKNDMRK